ncbi:MAG: GIY-YIG nuclease family protein [Candidatus Peribacteraceae bacterium]|nr:GIY-YIG nuclease family protein [Candidatus Peribacteraceae bacterium]
MIPEEKIYYVYILASRINGTLYVGVTNDLQARVLEHKGIIPEESRDPKKKSFTKKYGVNKLVYYEEFDDIEEAIRREKRLKKWNRAWKIQLIHEKNPSWKDLYHETFEWDLDGKSAFFGSPPTRG